MQLVLRPASDNAHLMRPMVVNRFPNPDLEGQYRHFRLCANLLALFLFFLVPVGDGDLTNGLA